MLPLVRKGGKSVNFFVNIVQVDAELLAGNVNNVANLGASAVFFYER